MLLTVLCSAQVQHQQVGDALVLGERQTERRPGLGAEACVSVHAAVGVSVRVAVDSVRDVVAYRGETRYCTPAGGRTAD